MEQANEAVCPDLLNIYVIIHPGNAKHMFSQVLAITVILCEVRVITAVKVQNKRLIILY